MSFWNCTRCGYFVAGLLTLKIAIDIIEDPEGSAAEEAIYTIYDKVKDRYGHHHMEREKFFENTLSFAGEVNDLKFIFEYPKKVCEWFKQC